MSFRKKIHIAVPEHANLKLRIAVWCAALLACVFFSILVLTSDDNVKRQYNVVQCQEPDYTPYEIAPGSTLEQRFTALGQSVGEVSHLYLNILRDAAAEGSLSVRLHRESTGEILADITKEYAEMPACRDVELAAAQAREWSAMTSAERLDAQINAELTAHVTLGDGGWYYLKSGENYRLEVTNHSETDSIYLLGNAGVQSGKLTIDGQQQTGFVNLSWMRKSLYAPSRLAVLMVLLTDATVLLGLTLVLFTEVKEHILYLVLAVGFGIVMLFDLTPIYGFDMKFQFDSTYVVSNQMLGLEGAVTVPKQTEPDKKTVAYYRRACDDYSQYQFYYDNEVSANYTDMKAALRSMFASEAGKELVLVETNTGGIGEQLYLYIPQAIGFTIARLLGLGMYPMLQIARILVYAIFVIAMYASIRKMPFGKRIFLVLALTPTVMIQTVSITRDAMIMCMSFYLIASVLHAAYAERRPRVGEWAVILLISALLAPCKMIYLPLSFFWLLIIYRQYIYQQKVNWPKTAGLTVGLALPILCFFVLTNLSSISNLSQSESTSLYGTQAYSVSYILTHIPEAVFVFANTLRTELGEYLVNAIQLLDIRLGQSDTVTVIVLILLVIESAYVCQNRERLLPVERLFFFLVAMGVLLLVSLASMQWTPIDSGKIIGLQGRYLTPVLPLLCMSFINNRTVRISGNPTLFVQGCCCVFPAICLMNMYLWTVLQ